MSLPHKRTLVLGGIALAFLVTFGWIIATQGPLAPVKVTLDTAKETRLERTLFGVATVEARRSHSIGPTLAGRVARVMVDQGDAVKAGQLLAEMEPVDLDARLAAGTASAAAAAQRVQSADAALAEAGSRARLAKNSADRYADLRQKNFVSQEAVSYTHLDVYKRQSVDLLELWTGQPRPRYFVQSPTGSVASCLP